MSSSSMRKSFEGAKEQQSCSLFAERKSLVVVKNDEEFIDAKLLDKLDSCLNCVEDIESQHLYEDKIDRHLTNVLATALTREETILLRSKLLEERRNILVTRKKSNKLRKSRSSSDANGTVSTVVDLCGLEDLRTVISQYCIACKSHDSGSVYTMPHCSSSMEDAATTRALENGSSNFIKSVKTSKQAAVASVDWQYWKNRCFICEEATSEGENISNYFPCCGKWNEKVNICSLCTLLLTDPLSSSDNSSERIGRCPRCRTFLIVHRTNNTSNSAISPAKKSAVVPISENKTTSIKILNQTGVCKICNQQKDVLVAEDNTVCDACFIGKKRPLLYECQECHQEQKIPFPLYRYQPSQEEFGCKVWQCFNDCHPHFTKWKILPSQLKFIPLLDEPEEWGVDYMKLAKERVIDAKSGFSAIYIESEAGNKGNSCGDAACCTLS